MADSVIEIASKLGAVRLRPEREDDHAFRFALFCETHSAEFALLPLEPAALGQLLSLQFRAQTTSYRSGFPNARFDIIELDHTPVGRIVVDRPGDRLHIVDQAIISTLRNSGLGSTIMQALMDEANGAGQMVRLKVAAANHGAMRLYRRLGFVPVVTEPLYVEMQWPAPPSA